MQALLNVNNKDLVGKKEIESRRIKHEELFLKKRSPRKNGREWHPQLRGRDES